MGFVPEWRLSVAEQSYPVDVLRVVTDLPLKQKN